MRHILALVLALLSPAVGEPVVVRAQDGTPGPAECRVEPRSVASIRRMIAALPTEVPIAGTPPPGNMVEVGGAAEAPDVILDGTPLVVAGTVVATVPPRRWGG